MVTQFEVISKWLGVGIVGTVSIKILFDVAMMVEYRKRADTSNKKVSNDTIYYFFLELYNRVLFCVSVVVIRKE